MHKIARAAVIAAGLGLIAAATASGQMAPAKPGHLRGTIEKVDGNLLTVKVLNGGTTTVKLADNPRIAALVKIKLADIKQGDFLSITAMPQADGSQKAIGLAIFMDAQRSVVPHVFIPWDRQAGSTMTNGEAQSIVTGVDGQTITAKYKDGEKKVIVPPDTPIVRFVPGNKDDLKPGAQFFMVAATKQADGSYTAAAINVGRDGASPPM